MAWQDWVFAVGGLLILISLVPTIRAEEKPALTTSLMTTLLVAIFATTMVTLGLWLAAITNYGIAAAWGLLAVQAYRQKMRSRHEGLIPQIEEELLHSLPHALVEHEPEASEHPVDIYALGSKAEASS